MRAGPQLLEFLNHNLIRHQESIKIAHINGYNLVPTDNLTNPDHPSRLSIYPESYAWATWDRAWKKYDDDMSWAKNASIQDIKKICGSTTGALRWKLNFGDAAAERVDTWAYRWLASMWEHELLMVSPNRNISYYEGWRDGTHTKTKMRWEEPVVKPLRKIETNGVPQSVDLLADNFLGTKIFGETLIGSILGLLVTTVLTIRGTRR